MKTKFIINPIAGTGKQIGIENSILNIVDKTIFDYDIILIMTNKDSQKFIQPIISYVENK